MAVVTVTPLDKLRALGLPMVSRYPTQPYTERLDDGTELTGTAQMFCSWTTDAAKIAASREVEGVLIREYGSTDPRFVGAEVGVRVVEWSR